MSAVTRDLARTCVERGLKSEGDARLSGVPQRRRSRRGLEERFTKRTLFADNVATLGSYEFVFGKGGVPLIDHGRVVGAVGVSGAVPADNDHDIADAAAGHPVVPTSH